MSLGCPADLSWVGRAGVARVRVLTNRSSPFVNGEKHENSDWTNHPIG